MGKLRARERAGLPDRAFAYIDSKGQRRLPIHDEAHVRNALARFDRVAFEDGAARERARRRLLVAAKRFGIVPVGFITRQIRSERASPDLASLPTGTVTFLLTDIEGSTRVLELLGDGYAGVLRDARSLIRNAVRRNGGQTVDARADEYFAVFERPAAAIQAAIELQRTMVERSWPNGLELRVRAGVHTGRPALTDDGYVGIAVHTVARVASVAHGGQILVSGKTRTAVQGSVPPGVRLRSLGRQRLAGIAQPETLYQVNANGLADRFPPPRTR
jgi:class 3 adenylate cyclase